MKRFLCIFLLLALPACSTPKRTGSIVVEKFRFDAARISDPVDIRADVLASIRDSLNNELLAAFRDDSKMIVTTSCDTGSYRLVGSIDEVYVRQHQDGPVRRNSVREFEILTRGSLVRCDNGIIVKDFEAEQDDEDMSNLLNNLANDIVATVASGPDLK